MLTYKELINVSCKQQGGAAAYTSNICLCSSKDTSREESSINGRYSLVHAELPGLTMLDFSSRLP